MLLLTLLYFTCSTQQGVGTPIRFHCCLQGLLVTSSSSSEAAAQLASVMSTRSALQSIKQADKAAASLVGELKLSQDPKAGKHAAQLHEAAAASFEVPPPNSIGAYYSSRPPPVQHLAARSGLLQWKQQLRQVRAWRVRQCTRGMTAAALHAASGRGMQVGGGRGYELDEEYEEWEDNLPFELGRLQQHPQLMNHLIKEHQAAHERDLAQYVPAPAQPSNSSSAWLRKHDTTSSFAAWLGSGISSLLGSSSSSSSSSVGEGDSGCSLDDAAVFADAPVWETSMDAMAPEFREVAAVVLQAEGRYDAGCALWPPAIYDQRDSGCCRKGSTAAGTAQQPQVAASRSAVRWQVPVVHHHQQQLSATASAVWVSPLVPGKAAVAAATAASVPTVAASETGASAAGATPAGQQVTGYSPRSVSPAAEGRNSSGRRNSSIAVAAARPIKIPAALPKHHLQGQHLPSVVHASSSSGSASKLTPYHKHNMSAIQEEDEPTEHAAAASRHAKQQQASLCEIEAAESGGEEQQVDCSAASDASLHFEHVMVV
jgi:hypothetical protein